MKKNTGFLGSLQKSTKVTLISCISFVLLTLLILLFFIFFPITPSEKIIASIGRENIFNNNPQNSVTAIPGITTSISSSTTAVNTETEEYTGPTTTKTYNIVITTGSGFMWNGRIPDGVTNTNTVVIYDEPEYIPPYTVSPIDTTDENNDVPDFPNVTTTTIDTDIPSTDVPVWTDPPVTDDVPVWTDTPSTDVPVWTDPPVNTDVPVWTEPPIIIDPPITDQSPSGNDEYNEW